MSWENKFCTYAQAFFESEGVPGGAVVVVQDGAVVMAKGFGSRDLETGKPSTPDTIFGIASLTKSFTSLALLMLEAAGELRLEHPVRKYLPMFRYPGLGLDDGGTVTLRHFASHTSGIPPLPGLSYALRPSQVGDPGEHHLRSYPPGIPTLESYPELLAFLAGQETSPVAAPGEVMSYQNDAYALLGAVIEVASGIPYEQFVKEHILKPLAMTRSTFSSESAGVLGNVTTLYAEDPQGRLFASPQWEQAPAHLATGFLKASARDLGRYLAFLLDPKKFDLPISAEGVGRLSVPLTWCAPLTAYGLGLMIQPNYHGVTLVRHGGGLKGVSSHMGFVPERGLGVAVLSNLEDKPASRLWLAAVNAVLGLEPETPLYSPPMQEAPLTMKQKLVGHYRSLEPWGKLVVQLKNDTLLASRGEFLTELGNLRLAPNGEFFVQRGAFYDGGRWLLDSNGDVRGVQLGMRFLERQEDAAR